jgi:hypothetical protein
MPFDRGGGPYQYRRSLPSRHEEGHRGRPSGALGITSVRAICADMCHQFGIEGEAASTL